MVAEPTGTHAEIVPRRNREYVIADFPDLIDLVLHCCFISLVAHHIYASPRADHSEPDLLYGVS